MFYAACLSGKIAYKYEIYDWGTRKQLERIDDNDADGRISSNYI
jgi:hypothetical protein